MSVGSCFQVLVTSGLRWRTDRLPDHKGRVLLFDFKTPKNAEELKITWKDPAYFRSFNPHGIDVFITSKKRIIVFIVNHNPHEAVERFEFDLSKKTLTHLESIQSPVMHLMNSVVATGQRSFFFTNFMAYRDGILAAIEVPLDLRWGSVGSYDGVTSQGHLFPYAYTKPNGLALSRDKSKLYLAAIGKLSIDTFSIKSLTNISLEESYVIGTVVDNIQIDAEDGSLWLGCHPVPWLSTLYLQRQDERISPAQVLQLKVDSRGIPLDDVTEIYVNRGTEISATTVAVHYQQQVLIGSISHNTVYCEIRT